MKKHLFLLLTFVVNLCAFASKDVVPSDAVLADYYDAGKVCVCIFVPADMACYDVVLTGKFNEWSTEVAACAKFEAVEGYDGWYVTSFEPEAEPDAEKGIQAKPVMLDGDGKFNRDYQVGAATLIRGGVQVVQGLPGEIDLVNYGTDAPNVYTVDAWKENPCTAVYHNYTIRVISEGCGGLAVPFLIGGMNNWKAAEMQIDVARTQELQVPVYSITFKAAEGTEYQLLSGLRDPETGLIDSTAQPGWNDESYLQVLVDDVWSRYNPYNSKLGEEALVVYDLRVDTMRWARCAPAEPAEYTVMWVNFPTENAPEAIEIIGTFDDWQGTAMEKLENGWFFVELEAKASQYFKFRSAGSWDQALEVYDAENDEWAKIGDNQYVFGQLWQDDTYKGTPCKFIGDYGEWDLSDPNKYRWSGERWILTVGSNPSIGGYVSGGGKYVNKKKVKITATPNYGYRFVQWSDGITDNPRTIQITQDTTFVAEFAINQYSISVTCDETYGTIDGENGEYDYLTEKIYEAIPNYGYHFDHWSDGNTDNPRTITLTQNTALTAIFAPNKYTIWDNSIQSQGSINGVGSFDYLSQQELTATPNYGNHFVQWSDGITDNPRTITLTKDTTFTAEFAVDMSGKCGDNLVWALEDGVLTIIGFGDMWNEKPWTVSTQQIKQVNFPKGLTSIGRYTFTECKGLTSISIPANVTMVGEGAFYGCTNITSFEGPVVAFESMVSSKITSVVINSGVLDYFFHLGLLSEVLERLDLSGADCSVLPKRALYDFYMLRELVLPINLETIGYMAVANCKNLQRITIPASVTDIAQSAFEDCRSLSDLTFAEGSKLETIGSWAFYNCHNLPKIEIPDGVTEIGDAAFYGCVYAESLKLPASIHSLGDNAFALCSKLNRMDVDAVVPPTIVAKTFNEVSRKAPVYVPDESVTLYKADPLWNELNIVGQHESPTGINPVTGNPSPVTHKVLRDGQILILRGNKVYTVTGQKVR